MYQQTRRAAAKSASQKSSLLAIGPAFISRSLLSLPSDHLPFVKRFKAFLGGASFTRSSGLITAETTVVFIIGASGTGKTTIRKCATGDALAQPSHSIIPNLTVGASQCSAKALNLSEDPRFESDGKFVFVEVPAFNADGSETSTNNFKAWFRHNWRTPRAVGVIYLHRISDTRVNERLDEHLDHFRAACKNAVKFPLKTVVMTTFWDEKHYEVMLRREEELKVVAAEQIQRSDTPLVLGELQFCRSSETPDSVVTAVSQLFP